MEVVNVKYYYRNKIKKKYYKYIEYEFTLYYPRPLSKISFIRKMNEYLNFFNAVWNDKNEDQYKYNQYDFIQIDEIKFQNCKNELIYLYENYHPENILNISPIISDIKIQNMYNINNKNGDLLVEYEQSFKEKLENFYNDYIDFFLYQKNIFTKEFFYIFIFLNQKNDHKFYDFFNVLNKKIQKINNYNIFSIRPGDFIQLIKFLNNPVEYYVFFDYNELYFEKYMIRHKNNLYNKLNLNFINYEYFDINIKDTDILNFIKSENIFKKQELEDNYNDNFDITNFEYKNLDILNKYISIIINFYNNLREDQNLNQNIQIPSYEHEFNIEQQTYDFIIDFLYNTNIFIDKFIYTHLFDLYLDKLENYIKNNINTKIDNYAKTHLYRFYEKYHNNTLENIIKNMDDKDHKNVKKYYNNNINDYVKDVQKEFLYEYINEVVLKMINDKFFYDKYIDELPIRSNYEDELDFLIDRYITFLIMIKNISNYYDCKLILTIYLNKFIQTKYVAQNLKNIRDNFYNKYIYPLYKNLMEKLLNDNNYKFFIEYLIKHNIFYEFLDNIDNIDKTNVLFKILSFNPELEFYT